MNPLRVTVKRVEDDSDRASPAKPSRWTSLRLGLTGFLLMPAVVGVLILLVYVVSQLHGRNLYDFWMRELLFLYLNLAILGFLISFFALAVGVKWIGDKRNRKSWKSWNVGRNTRGRSIVGCVLGLLGMALNGFGVFYFHLGLLCTGDGLR